MMIMHKLRVWLNRRLNLTPRNVEMVLGVYTAIKGLWLYSEKSFFFYPPSWVWIMDSPYLDIAIFLVGFLLFIFALCETDIPELAKLRTNAIKALLVILGAIMIWLALLGIMHGLFTNEFRMAHGALGNIVIFAIILLTIGDV